MLSNGLAVAEIMVLAYKTIEDLLMWGSANLLEPDGKQISHGTLNRALVDCNSGRLLSLGKRIGRGEFSGRQLDVALVFQKKKQASTDHVFKNAIGLSPIPLPANLLGDKAPAFIRVLGNYAPDRRNIFLGD
jgi:hypothetical protein